MKIIVTDGYTLNPGDLSWDLIHALGELTVYDRTPVELVVERCKGATIVITNKTPFNKEVLHALPALQCIAITATGFNIIDIDAARELGIVVCNAPAYGTASVAQHAFALLLEITNRVGRNAASTAAGKWERAIDWCYTEAPLTELDGKTFGVVGWGNIGQQTARIAKAFGMQILYYNHRKKDSDIGEQVNLNKLFAESDVVSLHCLLTSDNTGFLNAALLNTMKPNAVLINTARGGLINEQDLANALNDHVIAAAALDVLSKEPPYEGNPLLHAKNCIVTPHNAWISKEARQRIMSITVANIKAFLGGEPLNVVKGSY